MNLVLSNKQPLAPEKYERCAAEPVFNPIVLFIVNKQQVETHHLLLVEVSLFCRSNHF